MNYNIESAEARMSFPLELVREYIAAYRIAVSHDKALPARFAAATLIMIAVVALESAVPWLLRESTNALSVERAPGFGGAAVTLAGVYGLCWTAARVSEWIKTIFSSATLARSDAAFQKAYYAHLIRVKYARLATIDPGAMVSVIARSRTAFSAITFTLFWVIVPALFQLVVTASILWRVTNLAFAAAFVGAIGALFAATWRLAAKTKGAHARIFDASNLLSSHLVERLGFMLDIKLNKAYEREEAGLDRILARYVAQISHGNARLALLLAAQAFFTGLVLTIFTIVAATSVTRGVFRIGDFVMITGYVVALTAPFTGLAASLSDLRRSQLALHEGLGILALPPEPGGVEVATALDANPVYALSGVDISFGPRAIFRGANLIANRGEVTVLIGPSGNGKSTLVNLMLGLVRPERGRVELNGVDVSTLSPASISRTVAVVPQNPLIISGTLRENLAFGCADPPCDEQLLALVCALELQGLAGESGGNVLDVIVGVQGRALSGGERQRIALGRALARHTSVIVLDEPTSSQDPSREARVLEQVRHRVPTIIAITHREALLEMADRVYQVDEGRVVESGARRQAATTRQSG
ncbi:ATP-binding cassette domain-containing protein [Paraburkholderia sp. EG286B]|uniref:ATP-binding cassette domain-containing protein n=1 Tax=Paraburkholderia sp. EG286B TaxID=3237011 RepID=UPI0034D1C47C